MRSVAGEDRCQVGLDWELACRPSEAGMVGVGGEDREVDRYPVRSTPYLSQRSCLRVIQTVIHAILMSDVLHTRHSHV